MTLFPGHPPDPANDEKGAHFNDDGSHRYRCWRTWDPAKPLIAVVGLNPSFADAKKLDPTLHRVRTFARDWGFGGFEMWNLWSLCSTDPVGLWAWMRERDQEEHFEANVAAIFAELPRFRDVLCAWGDFSACPAGMRVEAGRVAVVAAEAIREGGASLWCLGRTKSGQPIHPLARGKSRIPDSSPRLPFHPTGSTP